MNYAHIAVGLSVGNFLYQAFAGGYYMVAAERSFFQCAAVTICWLLLGRPSD